MTAALIGAAVSWAHGAASAGASAAGNTVASSSPEPGVLQVDQGDVAASGTISLTFTYTADPNGFLKGGTFTLTIPDGWTAPSTTPGSAGYVDTTAHCAAGQCVPAVNSMTVTLSDVTLGPGQSFTLQYAGATAPGAVGTFDFTAQETPAADYLPVDVPPAPVTTCPNGVGAMAVSPHVTVVSTPADYLFTYSAGGCGLLPGSAVSLEVPGDWTSPSATPGDQGYTSVNTGTVTLTGSLITISGAQLLPGQTLTISYSGASTMAGDAAFYAEEQSGDNSILTPLASSPRVMVRQGSSSAPATSPANSRGTPGMASGGTMTVRPATVPAARRSTLTFTYTAPERGLPPSGALELTVPPGWTAPSQNPGSPGYASLSAGALAVADRTITITGVTLAAGRKLTITYHDGAAPRSPGKAEFRARERASAAAGFVLVAPSPVITVAGSGTPVPSWLIPLLAAALAAACFAVTVLTMRLRRARSRRQPERAAHVAANPHPEAPRVMAVTTTGHEPTLALRIEPHTGTIVRTLTR